MHTHYDAQVFWDGALTPSPLHGVTTALAGNCGFTIAPLSDDAADGEYLMRMLARVEGMPLESLRTGVPWNWTTTAEYFDEIEGRLGINAGFMVGHSAIRRVVMGEESTTREAKPEELDAMQRAAARRPRGRRASGFSSSWARTHNDAEGHMVPSRFASRDEIIDLCSTVSEYEGTSLEFIPMVGPVRAVGRRADDRDVGRRAATAELERARRQRQEHGRRRAEARGRHLRPRSTAGGSWRSPCR